MLARFWYYQQIGKVSLRVSFKINHIFFKYRNYVEAKKAYVNALKYEPENKNVLRDLALLQNQLGEWEEFAETRRKIVVLTPQINNWIAYCLAVYLTKDYKLCNTIFDSIDEILGVNPLESLKGNELNELYIFRTTLIEQTDGAKKAIKFITKNKKYILDETRYLEIIIKLYLKNNQKSKALESIHDLLKINPCNAEYYKLVFQAKDFDIEN